MSRSDNLCLSRLSCLCQCRRILLERSTKRRSRDELFGDTDLGLETQGYRKKCLQHKFVSKSRERLRFFYRMFAFCPNQTENCIDVVVDAMIA